MQASCEALVTRSRRMNAPVLPRVVTVPRISDGVTTRPNPQVTLYESSGMRVVRRRRPSARCIRMRPSAPLATNTRSPSIATCCGGAPAASLAIGRSVRDVVQRDPMGRSRRDPERWPRQPRRRRHARGRAAQDAHEPRMPRVARIEHCDRRGLRPERREQRAAVGSDREVTGERAGVHAIDDASPRGGRARSARRVRHRSRTRSAARARRPHSAARRSPSSSCVTRRLAMSISEITPASAWPTSAIVPPATVSMLVGPANGADAPARRAVARSSTTTLASSSAVASTSGPPRPRRLARAIGGAATASAPAAASSRKPLRCMSRVRGWASRRSMQAARERTRLLGTSFIQWIA